jgi:hypothetical protein
MKLSSDVSDREYLNAPINLRKYFSCGFHGYYSVLLPSKMLMLVFTFMILLPHTFLLIPPHFVVGSAALFTNRSLPISFRSKSWGPVISVEMIYIFNEFAFSAGFHFIIPKLSIA